MTQNLKEGIKSIDILYEGHHKGNKQISKNEQERKAWNELHDAKRDNLIVEGYLIAVESHSIDPNNKDNRVVFGVVDYEGVRGYIEIDEFPAKNKDDLTSYIGNPISFKILSDDEVEDNFFMASRKAALNHMQKYFDRTAENNVAVKAIVDRVESNQVRINVGGYDVVLPIHDMGFGWIRNINDLVKDGDIIDVMILDKGDNRQAPKVSRKAVLKNPFPDCLERYQEGSNYLGTITGFTEAGVFVNLEQGVDTLATAEVVEDMGVGDKIVIRIRKIRKLQNVNENTPPDRQYQINSRVVRKA